MDFFDYEGSGIITELHKYGKSYEYIIICSGHQLSSTQGFVSAIVITTSNYSMSFGVCSSRETLCDNGCFLQYILGDHKNQPIMDIGKIIIRTDKLLNKDDLTYYEKLPYVLSSDYPKIGERLIITSYQILGKKEVSPTFEFGTVNNISKNKAIIYIDKSMIEGVSGSEVASQDGKGYGIVVMETSGKRLMAALLTETMYNKLNWTNIIDNAPKKLDLTILQKQYAAYHILTNIYHGQHQEAKREEKIENAPDKEVENAPKNEEIANVQDREEVEYFPNNANVAEQPLSGSKKPSTDIIYKITHPETSAIIDLPNEFPK